MSLAEDLRRPFEGTARRDGAPRVTPKEPDRAPSATVRALRADTRRPVEPASQDSTADSMNLLDRASKSVVFLLSRYQQLEEHVRQLDAWSKAQIQAAESAATRWQETAEGSDAKIKTLEATLEAMRARADAAEQALQRDARTLEALQERIIAAFGFGSEAHDALTAIGIA